MEVLQKKTITVETKITSDKLQLTSTRSASVVSRGSVVTIVTPTLI